jgi:hypothetical protein
MLGDVPPHHWKAQRRLTLTLGAALIVGIGWLRTEKVKALEADPAHRLVHPYRLQIKLGEDALAGSINHVTTRTTLEELIALPRPKSIPVGRIVPLETQLWKVHVKVRSVFIEPDGDLVLRIEEGKAHATAEIPVPDFCPKSPFLPAISRLRSQLLAKFDPGPKPKPLHLEAEITGLGFAGLPDKYTRNGVCIYPALSVDWVQPSENAK